jgi:hypothetical protein
MGLRCIFFGCKDFEYLNKTTRKCGRCGQEYVFVKFYPRRPACWMEKDYVDYWGTYDNLVKVSITCEACGKKLHAGEDCTCNAC